MCKWVLFLHCRCTNNWCPRNIIAPKYWNDYKRSTGYWRGDDNIVDDWLYIDQKGAIMNGVDCKEEYKEYRKQHAFYDDKPEVV